MEYIQFSPLHWFGGSSSNSTDLQWFRVVAVNLNYSSVQICSKLELLQCGFALIWSSFDAVGFWVFSNICVLGPLLRIVVRIWVCSSVQICTDEKCSDQHKFWSSLFDLQLGRRLIEVLSVVCVNLGLLLSVSCVNFGAVAAATACLIYSWSTPVTTCLI